MINSLFHFHEGSPPLIREGGALWPMVEAAAASQIMYYGDRWHAGEHTGTILPRIREAWADAFKPKGQRSGSMQEAHESLLYLGTLIKTKFDSDNLHLTTRVGAESTERVVHAVQQLEGRLKEQGSQLSQQSVEIAGLRAAVAGLGALQAGAAAAGAAAAAEAMKGGGGAAPTSTAEVREYAAAAGAA